MSAPVASARAASVRTGMRRVTGTGGEGARRLSILIEEGLVQREARLLSTRGGGECAQKIEAKILILCVYFILLKMYYLIAHLCYNLFLGSIKH